MDVPHNNEGLSPIESNQQICSFYEEIFLEKHWKSVISKNVCDYFFEAQKKVQDPNDVPPVIATPHHYLISIYRDSIHTVAVTQSEVPPLFVIEFLHRVFDTFQDYFSGCSEQIINDQIVVVYELLEEMLDNGFPLATESNILKELIKPPNIINKVVNTVTGASNVSSELPTGSLSNVPWRRSGVKYANNEVYFDVTEEIDCIIDKQGSIINMEIQGYIDSFTRLSGMPDLSLSFINPRMLDDVSLHPCVRLKRWENEKVFSFIPPDGSYRLATYHVSGNMIQLPIYIRPQISFISGSSGRFELTIGVKANLPKTGSSGRFDLTVGIKANLRKTVAAMNIFFSMARKNYFGYKHFVNYNPGRLESVTKVEQCVATIQMPQQVLNCNLSATVGTHSFDPVKKILRWEIGKINPQKVLPNLRGNISLVAGSPPPEDSPVITMEFRIGQYSVSGLKVNRLDIYGERYKPFKGVKYVTKAGKFQVRT